MIRLVLIAITFLAVISPGHSFKDQDFKVTVIAGHLAWRLTAAFCSSEALPFEGLHATRLVYNGDPLHMLHYVTLISFCLLTCRSARTQLSALA